jgi:hypothetical protein
MGDWDAQVMQLLEAWYKMDISVRSRPLNHLGRECKV